MEFEKKEENAQNCCNCKRIFCGTLRLRTRLIVCEVILLICAIVYIILGHRNVADLALATALLALALTSLSAVTFDLTKYLQLGAIAASAIISLTCFVRSVLNLMDAAHYLQTSWYPILVEAANPPLLSEETVEKIFIVVTIVNISTSLMAALTSVCISSSIHCGCCGRNESIEN